MKRIVPITIVAGIGALGLVGWLTSKPPKPQSSPPSPPITVHTTTIPSTPYGTLDAPTVAAPGTIYTPTVIEVVDGDTLKVSVPSFKRTPWDPVYIRVSGIDTPEVSTFNGAKCPEEIALGKAASAYGKTLVQPNQKVHFIYRNIDKYGNRLDGDVRLLDGRDWGQLMIQTGHAKPYNGQGPKPNWCPLPPIIKKPPVKAEKKPTKHEHKYEHKHKKAKHKSEHKHNKVSKDSE